MKRKGITHVDADSLEAGVQRKRSGKGFAYYNRGKKIQDPKRIKRFNALRIPPAWRNVNISRDPYAHLQATGIDDAGRKQYIYHPEWRQKRSLKKFNSLLEFGTSLPDLRRAVQAELKQKGWTIRKLVATAIRLVECSHIRTGSEVYERTYSSYGLTTLEAKHVRKDRNCLLLAYRGKKGVAQMHRISDRYLINLIRKCKELPGKKLFQFSDSSGLKQTVKSGDINDFIHEAMNKPFTAKDFRTWAGSVYAYQFWLNHATKAGEGNNSILIKDMLADVSKRLGNTPAVCRSYYIHPEVLKLFDQPDKIPSAPAGSVVFGKSGLSPLEKVLIKLLKKSTISGNVRP